MDKSAADTASKVGETIKPEYEVDRYNDASYYHYDEVFLQANLRDGSGDLRSDFALPFKIFSYAANRAVEPTYEDYALYYYPSLADLQNDTKRQILEKDMPDAAGNPYLQYEGNNLIAKDKMAELWLVAVSPRGERGAVVSRPIKLTIYPTNILDLKRLRIDPKTGIISTDGGTSFIDGMDGYEVIVKSKRFEFTKFIATGDTELWLKLYRYSVASYDVSVNVVYAHGTEFEYRFAVPTADFHGLAALPKDQFADIGGLNRYSAVVVYDLYRTSYAFGVDMIFDAGVKYMYIYGNPAAKHTGLNFTFNNGAAPVEIALNGVQFAANNNRDALRINGDGLLTLDVVGQVKLYGGAGDHGKKGADGYAYSKQNVSSRSGYSKNGRDWDIQWNPFGENPDGENGRKGDDGASGKSGERGENGRNGGFAIRLQGGGDFVRDSDKIVTRLANGATLKLCGGRGGDGGAGGSGDNGQGGQNGGCGGNGGTKYCIVFNLGGKGGAGGAGGTGGGGGNAGDGGNAGLGGMGINSTCLLDIYGVDSSCGRNGTPGKAGTAGKGGNKGLGGAGGAGGTGYYVVVLVPVSYVGAAGSYGSDGEKGNDGTAGKAGSYEVYRNE